MDKYTWVNYGSSYLPSDMNAAYLWAQLEEAEKINSKRLALWKYYHENLAGLAEKGFIEQPFVPDYATHNAHMYYIKVKDPGDQNKTFGLSERKGDFKCISLCSSSFFKSGSDVWRFHGEDVYTTKESERLLRLPMYYSLSFEEAEEVVRALQAFNEY